MMIRTISSKVMRVGRATMFMGLAVMVALVFGVATTAVAGTGVGGVFNLGVLYAIHKRPYPHRRCRKMSWM